MQFSQITDNAVTYVENLMRPTVRLGVTGLSRSGKTVFITALINNLIDSGLLPFFEPVASNRIESAFLTPPPPETDLFNYSHFIKTLKAAPAEWPQRTNTVSELRIALTYQPNAGLRSYMGARTIYLDVVDYPGEWLLDLPLLGRDFVDWSREAVTLAEGRARKTIAEPWLNFLNDLDPCAPHDNEVAITGSQLFRNYLIACRSENHALSTLPPGRFLEPGPDAQKPMLNFMPLRLPDGEIAPENSLWSEMSRWYEAYKSELVVPFFREHFARLDCQVVLVDTLRALNAGPAAVEDLQRALSNILACFNQGHNTIISSIFAPRIEKILFAATKADHLHSNGYDRLRSVMKLIVGKAMQHAIHSGADVGVEVIAAIRATRQASVSLGGQRYECISGIPMPEETIDGRTYDGTKEAIIFPGQLPADPEAAVRQQQNIRFVRFRPPTLDGHKVDGAIGEAFPHIRMDHALQFLLGDWLK